MPGAMDLGIADHGERASCEEAAQIAIALFADTAETLCMRLVYLAITFLAVAALVFTFPVALEKVTG